MDADYIENQRDQLLSRRENRWSMNSQRLEEILAELMRPIRSAQGCFDMDLSALLEEYLTETGLHSYDGVLDLASASTPNYVELALLLQQTATIYSCKVDFLYQHVLGLSETLHTGTGSPAAEEGAAPSGRAGTTGGARARAVPPREDFVRTASPYDASRFAREPVEPRPHPTLPRFFMELHPRAASDTSWQAVRDYAGELVGHLDDFQATWEQNRQSGMLEDDWFDVRSAGEQQGPPAISMLELQAAIDAAAPPPLAPCGPLASPPCSPLRCSTPLPSGPQLDATEPDTFTEPDTIAEPDTFTEPDTSAEPDTTADPAPSADLDTSPDTEMSVDPDTSTALGTSVNLTQAAPVRRERKRRRSRSSENAISIENNFSLKVMASKYVEKIFEERKMCYFRIESKWIRRLVNNRANQILSERQRLDELKPAPRAEFAGWSTAEAEEAAARVSWGRAASPYSDDDGFFEQSSVGDGCDTSRGEDTSRTELGGPRDEPAWAAWQAGVLRRAAAAEARGGLDVHALGHSVLRALPAAAPAHFRDVLRSTARADHDVSHVLLATLFLVNEGSVRLLPGAPLSLDSFSLQLQDDPFPRRAALC